MSKEAWDYPAHKKALKLKQKIEDAEYQAYQEKLAKAMSSESVPVEVYNEIIHSPYHSQAIKDYYKALNKTAKFAEVYGTGPKKLIDILKDPVIFKAKWEPLEPNGLTSAYPAKGILYSEGELPKAFVDAYNLSIEKDKEYVSGKGKAEAIKGFKIKSVSVDDKNQFHAQIDLPIQMHHIGMDLSSEAKAEKWLADHVKGTNIDGVMIDDNAEMNLPIPITESGPLFATMFDEPQTVKAGSAKGSGKFAAYGPTYLNPLPFDMTEAHFELFIKEFSRKRAEDGMGDWQLAEWCNQMTPPCCDRVMPLQLAGLNSVETYFKSIVNHHFPHLADIQLEPEERVELTLTGLTKREAEAMLKYHQKTHSAKPVLVSTKKLKEIGPGSKAVVKWEFDSSSMAYNGTAVKYIAQLNTDGTVSCNCQGYVIQKKNSDGSPKPRRCKHTDAVADQVDVHLLFKKWKKGEDLGPDFVAEGSTTAHSHAVSEIVYSAKRIVEI